MSKTVSVTWDGELSFDGVSGSGHTLRMDGRGNVTGFSPMELMILGLAGCTGMDVIDILRKKRQDVTAFAVNVRGTQANEHPFVYTDIEVEYVVRGHGVDPKAVERAIELSQTKYCPTSAMLCRTATLRSSYRIEEAEAAPEAVPA
ncbi:MAG: OsmC family protein [Chloroflexi bacterium]|nr:OsmC family protein [Chloroflexota bacterium]